MSLYLTKVTGGMPPSSFPLRVCLRLPFPPGPEHQSVKPKKKNTTAWFVFHLCICVFLWADDMHVAVAVLFIFCLGFQFALNYVHNPVFNISRVGGWEISLTAQRSTRPP